MDTMIKKVELCHYSFATGKTTKRELKGEELEQWIKENTTINPSETSEGEKE